MTHDSRWFLHSGWPGLLLIVAVYLGLSFYQIELPGLHYDEAFEAVPAVQLLTYQPVVAFRNAGIRIGPRLYPLMTQDYIGALNLYASIPFISMLGPTPTALRTMSILTGTLTLILTYMLAKQLTKRPWVGLLAALLLAVDPTFIFWNRQGVFVTAMTATIGLAATYCWLRRFQTGLWRWSIAGAVLFGLGLYAKILFLWLIAALVGAVLLLNLHPLVKQRRTWLKRTRQLVYPEGTLVIIAFLAGCWPLLAYNLQTGGTLISIGQNAATSYYGVDNLAIGSNLLTRISQLVTLLDGGHLWYLGQIYRNPIAVILFALNLLLVITIILRKSWQQDPATATYSPPKIALFPLLVILLVMIASVVTVSALWVTHFAILMPWPALALASGIWLISLARRTFRWSPNVPIWVGITLLVITNLVAVIRYHRALTTSGGLSSHSDAVYRLSSWLQANTTGQQVVAMDWGLAAPVVFLTNGQVNAVEVFGYHWQADVQLTDRLQNFIAQPDTLYLWRAPDEVIFDRSGQFKTLYQPQHLEETIEEAFYERSGRPLLGVTRLVEQGKASNPPK